MHMMFIEGELKPGKRSEFVKAWGSQILPLLKQQDGFVNEILLYDQDTQQPCGLTFWKTREQCERYQREVFPQAKAFVAHLMLGRRRCATSTLTLQIHFSAWSVR